LFVFTDALALVSTAAAHSNDAMRKMVINISLLIQSFNYSFF